MKNSITFFNRVLLTQEQIDNYLSLSKVGKAVYIENGEIDKYHRLRNLDLADVPTAFTFPERLEDETNEEYIIRTRPDGVQAFNNLKQGNIDAIWLSESGFNLLSQQPEYQAL